MNYTCPHCQARLAIPEGTSGEVVCPNCSARLQAPDPTPPPVPSVQERPRKPVGRKRPGWLSLFTFRHLITPRVILVYWNLAILGSVIYLGWETAVFLGSFLPKSADVEVEQEALDPQSVRLIAVNRSDFDARDVQVAVTITPPTRIVRIYPITANTEEKEAAEGGEATRLFWSIASLAAGGRDSMTIELEEGFTGDIHARWQHRGLQGANLILALRLLGRYAAVAFGLFSLRLLLEFDLILFRIEEHLRPHDSRP